MKSVKNKSLLKENITREEEYLEKYEKIIEKFDTEKLKNKGFKNEEEKDEKESGLSIKDESQENSFQIKLPYSI